MRLQVLDPGLQAFQSDIVGFQLCDQRAFQGHDAFGEAGQVRCLGIIAVAIPGVRQAGKAGALQHGDVGLQRLNLGPQVAQVGAGACTIGRQAVRARLKGRNVGAQGRGLAAIFAEPGLDGIQIGLHGCKPTGSRFEAGDKSGGRGGEGKAAQREQEYEPKGGPAGAAGHGFCWRVLALCRFEFGIDRRRVIRVRRKRCV